MRSLRMLAVLGLVSAITVGVGASVLGGEPEGGHSRQGQRWLLAPAPPSEISISIEPPTISNVHTEPESVTTTTTISAGDAPTREDGATGESRGVPSPAHSWPVSLEPCGGDLPPCWVKNAESHGDYNAINPTGCGGRGCFGAWQFSGEWAGRLGLPMDLRTATPQQQDDAARELWRGGAGCANWAAC